MESKHLVSSYILYLTKNNMEPWQQLNTKRKNDIIRYVEVMLLLLYRPFIYVLRYVLLFIRRCQACMTLFERSITVALRISFRHLQTLKTATTKILNRKKLFYTTSWVEKATWWKLLTILETWSCNLFETILSYTVRQLVTLSSVVRSTWMKPIQYQQLSFGSSQNSVARASC